MAEPTQQCLQWCELSWVKGEWGFGLGSGIISNNNIFFLGLTNTVGHWLCSAAAPIAFNYQHKDRVQPKPKPTYNSLGQLENPLMSLMGSQPVATPSNPFCPHHSPAHSGSCWVEGFGLEETNKGY